MHVGARSLHRQPAATITVPDDPAALMRAVSTFGSGLKETSPERSWPTLRGHPPRIERGELLEIPSTVSSPQTDITIHVPPAYDYVYPVTPLAYYLGANVVPGETPRLTGGSGFVHTLDTERRFAEEVARVLKQVFLFDCVARGYGYFYMDLHERTVLEARSRIDVDFESVYEDPLAEQLRQYLSVPYSAVADVVPEWSQATYVRPDPQNAPFLPYLANELSTVRTELVDERGTRTPEQPHRESAIATFKRDNRQSPVDQSSERDRSSGRFEQRQYVPLPEVDATEAAWVGDETPERGSKLLLDAFDGNCLEPKTTAIDVTVVCNDPGMRDEHDAVAERYGVHEMVSFNVRRHEAVSTANLRELLTDETDLFHYIGHIDDRGFECPDGWFDARSLEETGATSVLLNACRSYDQGTALVEAGSSAAVVSLGDVENAGATRVGESFAGLLNFGFSIGSARNVVSNLTAIGRQYVVLGNPAATVAQCADGVPSIVRIDSTDDGQFDVTHSAHKSSLAKMGSACFSTLVEEEVHYLIPSTIDIEGIELSVIEERIEEGTPVVLDGELRWFDGDVSNLLD